MDDLTPSQHAGLLLALGGEGESLTGCSGSPEQTPHLTHKWKPVGGKKRPRREEDSDDTVPLVAGSCEAPCPEALDHLSILGGMLFSPSELSRVACMVKSLPLITGAGPHDHALLERVAGPHVIPVHGVAGGWDTPVCVHNRWVPSGVLGGLPAGKDTSREGAPEEGTEEAPAPASVCTPCPCGAPLLKENPTPTKRTTSRSLGEVVGACLAPFLFLSREAFKKGPGRPTAGGPYDMDQVSRVFQGVPWHTKVSNTWMSLLRNHKGACKMPGCLNPWHLNTSPDHMALLLSRAGAGMRGTSCSWLSLGLPSPVVGWGVPEDEPSMAPLVDFFDKGFAAGHAHAQTMTAIVFGIPAVSTKDALARYVRSIIMGAEDRGREAIELVCAFEVMWGCMCSFYS